MARSKTVEVLGTTVTVTSGEAVAVSLLTGQWHEALIPIVVSGVDASHAVDIEVSADNTNWVPAKDLNDNVLTNIVAPAVYIMSGKMNYVRGFANTVADTSNALLIQIIRSE